MVSHTMNSSTARITDTNPNSTAGCFAAADGGNIVGKLQNAFI